MLAARAASTRQVVRSGLAAMLALGVRPRGQGSLIKPVASTLPEQAASSCTAYEFLPDLQGQNGLGLRPEHRLHAFAYFHGRLIARRRTAMPPPIPR